MDRIDLYRIFVRVVDARSFTRAADTLLNARFIGSPCIKAGTGTLPTRFLKYRCL